MSPVGSWLPCLFAVLTDFSEAFQACWQYVPGPVTLTYFGVPISDFFVSETAFVLILHAFGDACLVKTRGGEVVLTYIVFCRCS